MRKINCYTESLLESYRRNYVREMNKFFKASRLTMDLLEVPFILEKTNWKIIGRQDDKELICKNLDDFTIWSIRHDVVQRCLLGETNTSFKARKLKKVGEDQDTNDFANKVLSVKS